MSIIRATDGSIKVRGVRPTDVIKPAPTKRLRPRPRPRPRPWPKPSPSASWPSWVDDYRYTIADAPTFAAETVDEPYVPTQADEDEATAYQVGYSLDLDVVPPAEWDDLRKLAWWYHRNLGFLARETDDFLIDRAAHRHSDPILDSDIYRPGATS